MDTAEHFESDAGLRLLNNKTKLRNKKKSQYVKVLSQYISKFGIHGTW